MFCRMCMRRHDVDKGLLPVILRSRHQKPPGVRSPGKVLLLTCVSLSFQACITGMLGQQSVPPGNLPPVMNLKNVPSASRQTRLFFKVEADQKTGNWREEHPFALRQALPVPLRHGPKSSGLQLFCCQRT